MTVASQYWDHIVDGEFLLQRCADCEEWIYYPREWCPECFGIELQWKEAAGEGTVLTYTVVHETPIAAYADRTPYVIAVVRLEEGPQMMANVVNCEPGDVDIGTHVRVTFESGRERPDSGDSDQQIEYTIPQFEPITCRN
jgi:uncharacterized OB-fold protein